MLTNHSSSCGDILSFLPSRQRLAGNRELSYRNQPVKHAVKSFSTCRTVDKGIVLHKLIKGNFYLGTVYTSMLWLLCSNIMRNLEKNCKLHLLQPCLQSRAVAELMNTKCQMVNSVADYVIILFLYSFFKYNTYNCVAPVWTQCFFFFF